VAQQEGADLALLDTDLLRGGRACPDETADRLVRRVGDPDRGQLAGAQEAGQGERVAPVGLDPVARLPRDQRRRDDGAMVPEPGEEPVQAVAGRAGLVAEVQAVVLGGQPRRQAAHALRRGVHLAEEAHLPVAPGVRDGHGVAQLGGVDPDEGFPYLGHGPSSLVGRGSYHPAGHRHGIDDPGRSSPERTYDLTVDPVLNNSCHKVNNTNGLKW